MRCRDSSLHEREGQENSYEAEGRRWRRIGSGERRGMLVLRTRWRGRRKEREHTVEVSILSLASSEEEGRVARGREGKAGLVSGDEENSLGLNRRPVGEAELARRLEEGRTGKEDEKEDGERDSTLKESVRNHPEMSTVVSRGLKSSTASSAGEISLTFTETRRTG